MAAVMQQPSPELDGRQTLTVGRPLPKVDTEVSMATVLMTSRLCTPKVAVNVRPIVVGW
jgi:hypothetical protein